MAVMFLVMVLAMFAVVMVGMLRFGKGGRSGKDHQQQYEGKNLLHGENVPRSRGQW
jgi:hypothetical protein